MEPEIDTSGDITPKTELPDWLKTTPKTDADRLIDDTFRKAIEKRDQKIAELEEKRAKKLIDDEQYRKELDQHFTENRENRTDEGQAANLILLGLRNIDGDINNMDDVRRAANWAKKLEEDGGAPPQRTAMIQRIIDRFKELPLQDTITPLPRSRTV